MGVLSGLVNCNNYGMTPFEKEGMRKENVLPNIDGCIICCFVVLLVKFPNTFPNMNVLLLEDEPELSAVACEQIETRGHKVFPAFDIAHAKSILEDESINIDILVADQQVPDGNGSLFAIETKGMSSGIKVVVVSGLLSGSDVEQLQAHDVDYYNKPSLYSDIVEDLIGKHFPDNSETAS